MSSSCLSRSRAIARCDWLRITTGRWLSRATCARSSSNSGWVPASNAQAGLRQGRVSLLVGRLGNLQQPVAQRGVVIGRHDVERELGASRRERDLGACRGRRWPPPSARRSARPRTGSAKRTVRPGRCSCGRTADRQSRPTRCSAPVAPQSTARSSSAIRCSSVAAGSARNASHGTRTGGAAERARKTPRRAPDRNRRSRRPAGRGRPGLAPAGRRRARPRHEQSRTCSLLASASSSAAPSESGCC